MSFSSRRASVNPDIRLLNAITAKYEFARRRHGGLRGLLRHYRPLHLVDAALREVWEAFGMKILYLLGRGPASGYGWFEALLSPTADYWLRYAAVVNALTRSENNHQGRIVEVSSGGWGGIAWALQDRERNICLVDWSADLIRDRRGGRAWRVCADGCNLPFADDSFDTAISVDTLEHLPRAARASFVEELKRIAKDTVLVTCPLQSEDGKFRARDYDRRLANLISFKRAVVPGWLEEHLLHEHPAPPEVADLLPGASMEELENCDQWWNFAASSQERFMWLWAALCYVWSARVPRPPFRRALFVWNKQS
jgi:SAM-dependent methyltransferase